MPKRRYRITIRLTDLEHRQFRAAADRSGLCLSGLARKLLLGVKPPRSARRPSVEATALVAILDRLGRIASDLAVAAAALAIAPTALPPFAERELRKALLDLRQLRPELLRALGKRPILP